MSMSHAIQHLEKSGYARNYSIHDAGVGAGHAVFHHIKRDDAFYLHHKGAWEHFNKKSGQVIKEGTGHESLIEHANSLVSSQHEEETEQFAEEKFNHEALHKVATKHGYLKHYETPKEQKGIPEIPKIVYRHPTTGHELTVEHPVRFSYGKAGGVWVHTSKQDRGKGSGTKSWKHGITARELSHHLRKVHGPSQHEEQEDQEQPQLEPGHVTPERARELVNENKVLRGHKK